MTNDNKLSIRISADWRGGHSEIAGVLAMNSPASDDGDILDSRRYKIPFCASIALVFWYLILQLAGRWIGPGTKAILLVAGYVAMCAVALWLFYLCRRYGQNVQSRFFLRHAVVFPFGFSAAYLAGLLDLASDTPTVPFLVIAVVWLLFGAHGIVFVLTTRSWLLDELRSFW
jgi:hypothetical protein